MSNCDWYVQRFGTMILTSTIGTISSSSIDPYADALAQVESAG